MPKKIKCKRDMQKDVWSLEMNDHRDMQLGCLFPKNASKVLFSIVKMQLGCLSPRLKRDKVFVS